MAKKISDLAAASVPLAGVELFEIVQGGVSKKVPASAVTGALVGVYSTPGGDVGIGTQTPGSSLEVVRSGSQADITATTYGVDGGGILHGRYARGTPASPLPVLSGDIFAGVGGRSYHSGGAFQNSSPTSIHWVASENHTPSGYGSYLRILTTPKGSTSRQERVLITDSGVAWCHGAGTFDPKIAAQSKPFGDTLMLASAVGEGASFSAVSYGGPTAGLRGGVTGGTAATPTATPNDVYLSFMGAHVFDGSIWSASTRALIGAKSTELATVTNQGTAITLETTKNGTLTRTERVRITGDGDLLMQVAGNGFRVKEGANAKQGTATLSGGTVTVSNASVTASSRIFLTGQQDGGTPGFLRISARSAGVSFTITSSSGSDASTVAYQIFEPA